MSDICDRCGPRPKEAPLVLCASCALDPESDMQDREVLEALARYGWTGKAVRAICAARGWRWTPQGAPAEWYAAWRGEMGARFAAAVVPDRSTRR